MTLLDLFARKLLALLHETETQMPIAAFLARLGTECECGSTASSCRNTMRDSLFMFFDGNIVTFLNFSFSFRMVNCNSVDRGPP